MEDIVDDSVDNLIEHIDRNYLDKPIDVIRSLELLGLSILHLGIFIFCNCIEGPSLGNQDPYLGTLQEENRLHYDQASLLIEKFLDKFFGINYYIILPNADVPFLFEGEGEFCWNAEGYKQGERGQKLQKIANILDGWSPTWISISAHSQLNLRIWLWTEMENHNILWCFE